MTNSRLLRGASAVFPLPEVLLTNKRITSTPEDPALLDQLWDTAGRLNAAGHTAARDIYTDDTGRLRRLEDKLGGQAQIAALLLTPAVAVGVAAVHRSPWVALPLVVVATVYIAATLYLTSHAARATPTAMPQPSHLSPDDPDRPLREYAYEQLRAIPYNAPRGLQLTNAIYGAQRCLFAAGVLLVVAAIVLGAGALEPGAKPAAPHPAPSRSP